MTDHQERRRGILYGRRKGHRLRARQAELVENLLPKLRIDLPQSGELDPAALFAPAVSQVWLEVGFGGGEHLAAQACAHEDIGIIGCEPFINGVAQLLCAIEDGGLANVRIYDDDARAVLDVLKPQSIARVFILFPDPWPKRRHNKRRFITRENLDMLARVIVPGGELRFASDIDGYVRWTLSHMRAHDAFEWSAQAPDDWRERAGDWPPTRYERKALDAGRRPAYLRFRRKP